jgi:hypothetical protein
VPKHPADAGVVVADRRQSAVDQGAVGLVVAGGRGARIRRAGAILARYAHIREVGFQIGIVEGESVVDNRDGDIRCIMENMPGFGHVHVGIDNRVRAYSLIVERILLIEARVVGTLAAC